MIASATELTSQLRKFFNVLKRRDMAPCWLKASPDVRPHLLDEVVVVRPVAKQSAPRSWLQSR